MITRIVHRDGYIVFPDDKHFDVDSWRATIEAGLISKGRLLLECEQIKDMVRASELRQYVSFYWIYLGKRLVHNQELCDEIKAVYNANKDRVRIPKWRKFAMLN